MADERRARLEKKNQNDQRQEENKNGQQREKRRLEAVKISSLSLTRPDDISIRLESQCCKTECYTESAKSGVVEPVGMTSITHKAL